MKKTLFIAIICLASIQIQAQSIQDIVSFNKFEVWIGQIEIEGIEVESIEQSLNANASLYYTANIKKADDSFHISIMGVDRNFATYQEMKSTEFFQDGFRMLYIVNGEDELLSYSILCFTNTDINSLIVIYYMPQQSKEDMLSVFENIQIDNLFK